MFCKCVNCGELLTKPIFYNGSAYGFTCIKKVYPNYKKSNKKTFFVKADSFKLEIIDEVTTKITANHYCSTKSFVDYQRTGNYIPSGLPYIISDIKLVDGEAFINLMKYKNSYELIQNIK
jgi:hypothetical protein